MTEIPKKRGMPLWAALFLVWGLLLFRDATRIRNPMEVLPYSRFLSLLRDHRVSEVRIEGMKLSGLYFSPPFSSAVHFSTLRPEDPGLIPELKESGIRFESVSQENWFRDLLGWILPMVALGLVWWWILGRMGRGQAQLGGVGKSRAKVFIERGLKIRFSDVAGVDEAKAELKEVVEFLKSPARFQRLGGRMPKGILLVGPPGTGKTLLARAVAGEAGVPFFSINGSEFVELFVGVGAARVRDLFQQAREQAPCIIFIDEMDALGKARGFSVISGGAGDEKEQTLNQLLAELDGFDSSGGVVLLAATNRPEILDPALLRSGRFDRQVVIDMPDRNGRARILEIHLKKVKVMEGIDPDTVASLTPGFSGADLENLVNEATLTATRRGAERVEASDFTSAIERIVGGLERRSRVLGDGEKKRIAFHEMGHATVSLALDQNSTIHKVSIIPRGLGALGYTFRRPQEERNLMDQTELSGRLSVLLGGRASEGVFFKEVSTGGADDLDRATEIAQSMVTRFGMSKALGMMTYERPVSPFLNPEARSRSPGFSDVTARLIDQEVLKLLSAAFERAEQVIRSNEDFVKKGVELLLEKESLDESEVRKLWDSWHQVCSTLSAGQAEGVVGSCSRHGV